MPNILRSIFQDHPFHLVSPSPWPLYTSISLLNLATSTALSMHNFYNSYNLNIISLILVISSMSFWFRGATVRLLCELSYWKIIGIFNCYLKKVYLANSNESTSFKDNSLPGKVGTGSGQALDPDQTQAVLSSEMGYSWSWDLYGSSKPVGYVQSIHNISHVNKKNRILPRKYGKISLWGLYLETKLATQTVCL